jgi:hypothetical protein
MANKSKDGSGIPWYSWVALVIMLGLGGVAFFLTYGLVVTSWLRWTVTIAWLVVTLGLGLYDFIIKPDSGGSIDKTAFDRWTISHGGAGLVFGVWYMPLFTVLLLVLFWELFEWLTRGFGDKEIILNRVVDVGIAVVLWLLVVIIVMAATGAPFPFFAPYMHS